MKCLTKFNVYFFHEKYIVCLLLQRTVTISILDLRVKLGAFFGKR